VSPDRAAVMEALGAVPEPCSVLMRRPTDIASMGLIESVEIEGGKVDVVLVLTDPSCVHFNGMSRYIADALADVEGVEEVEVTMSTTQLWTPDRERDPAGRAR
jgi:metal-sulfur cluster biosynthetic enzyme